MRRSLAKKGIDGAGKSTLAALLNTPTDPSNLRLSKSRPIKFVSTPRSQLSDMDYTELSVLEIEILRKIETVNNTISSLSVDPHTMKRAYENHLAQMRKANGKSNWDVEDGVDKARTQYSYLLLSPNDGMYGEEAMMRLRELFMEYCAPGMDVLGYAETRELLRDAGILPPIEYVENYISTSKVGVLSYGLSDAFQDLRTFESLVVKVLAESYDSDGNGGVTDKTTIEEEEMNSNLICANIPGLGLGLRYLGFVELIKRLEMEGRTSLLQILANLNKPLSSVSDRWRKRVEYMFDFIVKCAVEERGPTEDQIEYAKQQKELLKMESKKGRPQAKQRKRKKKKGGRGGYTFAQEKADLLAEKLANEKKEKEMRKREIIKRQIELKRAIKKDQTLQFKRRYNYDIDEIIDSKHMCIILYLLFNISLTEEDATLLLKPLVDIEILDDQVNYENAMNSQRTKRLRVIVEKQGIPPRKWPMRNTVVKDMINNKTKWSNLRDSEIENDYNDSRPSSRGSSRRTGSRSGSRSGSRHGSRPNSRNSSRPGSRGGTRSRPGTATSLRGGSWATKLMDVSPSPQLWSRRATLFIQSASRRLRNLGRKIRGYMMEDSMTLPITKKPINEELTGQQKFGKSKADRKARKKQKAKEMERLKQSTKENDCFTKCSINVGKLEETTVNMKDKDNVIFFETEWVKDKSIDVGDILDEVDCPDDCSTFASISFEVESKYATGKEEDDEEIDRSVQSFRRICKILFEKQIFEVLPNYHSYSVMYEPNQSPKQVRLSIYFKGSGKEIREEYGVPVMLNTIINSFNGHGTITPGSKTLFHTNTGESVIMDNEFQMRSDFNISYKRKSLKNLLEHTIRAMENFYPFVEKYHPEKVGLNMSNKNRDIVDLINGEMKKGGGSDGKDDDETEDGKKRKKSEKMNNETEIFPNIVNETEEVNGGTGIFLFFRKILHIIENNIAYSTKQEVEIALPSLSTLIYPDIPDFIQSYFSPSLRAKLIHFVKSPGGMIDTVKLIWNSIFGFEWSWENFNKGYFNIMDLLKYGETNKMDELIYNAHHTFRNVITKIREIRIQVEDRGFKTEFKNLYINGFMPTGPTKSMIAERERKKLEKLKRSGAGRK